MTKVRRFEPGTAYDKIVTAMKAMGYEVRFCGGSGSSPRAWAFKSPGAKRVSYCSWKEIVAMVDAWRIKRRLQPIKKENKPCPKK